jgi:hypothetical protein
MSPPRHFLLVVAAFVCTGACRDRSPEESILTSSTPAPSTRGSTAASPPQPLAEMNPKDILFTLPTLCDMAPPLQPMVAAAPEAAVSMHEDDWRQVEFVADGDRAAVDRELGELRRFKLEKQAALGWTDVYIRKDRPESVRPLGIRLPDILQAARAASTRDVYLTTGSGAAKVHRGFAVAVGDLTLYGHSEADATVASLGLLAPLPGILSAETRTALLALCRAYGLFVVDWYRVEVVAD